MATGLTAELSLHAANQLPIRDRSTTTEPPEAMAETLRAINARLDAITSIEESVAARLAELEQLQTAPEFVLNHVTKSLHRGIEYCDPFYSPSNSAQKRTVCGRKYLTAPHRLLRQPPAAHPWRSVCDKCLPELRAKHRVAQMKGRERGSSDSH